MSKFIPLDEAIDLILLGNDDLLKRDKGRFRKYAPHVYDDLNITSLKEARRESIQINKRTNTVDLPCNILRLCSVSVIDFNGTIHPVWLNDKLHDDIVDIPAEKDCACEQKCSYKLCNTIKGYEAITSIKSDFLPDATPISFTCVDRKAVDANGFFYSETQYPLRQYVSGVWVDTVLHTEQTKLCQVELDSKGCVCDTDHNALLLCNACGVDTSIPVGGTASCPPGHHINTWIYSCSSMANVFMTQCGGICRSPFNRIYNISELGDRLIFPHDFGYDRVLIRYYTDVNNQDLQIPMLAVYAFGLGLKWWNTRFNDKKQALANEYSMLYSKAKGGLLNDLNKHTIAEWRMILTPPVFVPTFNRPINDC